MTHRKLYFCLTHIFLWDGFEFLAKSREVKNYHKNNLIPRNNCLNAWFLKREGGHFSMSSSKLLSWSSHFNKLYIHSLYLLQKFYLWILLLSIFVFLIILLCFSADKGFLFVLFFVFCLVSLLDIVHIKAINAVIGTKTITQTSAKIEISNWEINWRKAREYWVSVEEGSEVEEGVKMKRRWAVASLPSRS